MSMSRVHVSGLKHVSVEEVRALVKDYQQGVISQADIEQWPTNVDLVKQLEEDAFNEYSDVARLLHCMCITYCEQGHICPRCSRVYMQPHIDAHYKLQCGCEDHIIILLEPHIRYPDGSENFKI